MNLIIKTFAVFVFFTASLNPVFSQSGKTTVDCSQLLTAAMVEEICGLTGIVERVTSVERNAVNCNRVYRVGKGWGDELIFILTPKSDASGASSTLDWMKKEYADMGLKPLNGIGDEAFLLNFTDKLTGRNNIQLVFRKNGMVIELKTEESRSAKTPCPCYNAEKLENLAKAMALKIQ